jgi:hypothetical protein
MSNPYHSPSLPQVGATPSTGCDRPPDDGCLGGLPGSVFVHDIMSSTELPGLYDEAGAIYADLPWARGFAEYNRRAGIADKRTFAQFIAQVDTIARWAAVDDRQVYVVSSDQSARQLSGKTYPIQLEQTEGRSFKAAVTVFNAPAPLDRTTTKLIDRLAREWVVIGDFACGYGNTIRAAISHGTGFVASDYSAEAIGYVCANVGKWK